MRSLFAAVLASLVTGLSFVSVGSARAATSDLVVHVYDIGQGSCVLIECPGDLPILVDCGKMGTGGGSIRAAARKINTVLDDYRDTYQPLRVILSHPDLDHYSLLSSRDDQDRYLLDPGKVRHVYFGGDYGDFGAAKAWISKAHERLSWPSAPYPGGRPCTTSSRISCLRPNEVAWGSIRSVACGRAKIDLLTANAQAYYQRHREEFPGTDWKSDGRKNGDSAVVRVTYEGVSFVVTGDAQEMTERLILANAQAAGQSLGGAGFLFGSHHGAQTHGSNGEDWIRATSPRFGIFSSNLGGGHGHPTCLVMGRFDTEADTSLADAPARSMPVRCDKEASPRSFHNKFLVTEATGDINITVRSGEQPMIICEKPGAACAW